MRENSSIQFPTTDPLNRLQPKAKSLFQNILAVSPYDAIFYADSGRYSIPKFLRMNILRTGTKKCGDKRRRGEWSVKAVAHSGQEMCLSALGERPLSQFQATKPFGSRNGLRLAGKKNNVYYTTRHWEAFHP